MARKAKVHFKLTPIPYWILTLLSIGLTGVLALFPTSIPYNSLGLVGEFLYLVAYDLSTMIQFVFISIVVLHLIEGAAAFVMCQRMNLPTRDTMLWTTQTTILGVSSFFPLLAKYKKMTKSQRHTN